MTDIVDKLKDILGDMPTATHANLIQEAIDVIELQRLTIQDVNATADVFRKNYKACLKNELIRLNLKQKECQDSGEEDDYQVCSRS